MSMERNDYVIIGYDLTEYRHTFYDKWAENEENKEKWEFNQVKGEIQLFSDPSSSGHLFFGYIVSARNEWDEDIVSEISIEDMRRIKPYVDNKMLQAGFDLEKIGSSLLYKVYCFTEYR